MKLSETIQKHSGGELIFMIRDDWASRAQKLEACVAAARELREEIYDYEDQGYIAGCTRTWHNFIEALKALEE